MSDLAPERIKSLEQRLTLEPQSPLFARLASYYLQVGRVKDALRLCDDGLAHHPFYTTAHVIKGKALEKLGMMAEARHEYEVVHEFLPSNDTIARLVSSIDLGTSRSLRPPAPVEEAPEAKAPAMAMPQVALEEPIVQEVPKAEAPAMATPQVALEEPIVQEAPEAEAPAMAMPQDALEEPIVEEAPEEAEAPAMAMPQDALEEPIVEEAPEEAEALAMATPQDAFEEPVVEEAPEPEAPAMATPHEALEEPIVEEAPEEAEAPAMAMPQDALEEPIVEEEVQPRLVEDTPPQEPVVTAEELFVPAEEPATQELVAEESQTFEPTEISHPVDESVGVEEQPLAEAPPEEPSAAEKLGLDMQAEPQQTLSDFSFDTAEQGPSSAQVEEIPFGTQPMEEPQHAIEPEPEQGQEPRSFESPMTEAIQASPEPAAPASETSGDETPDWFEAFSQLQQPAEVAAETPAESPSEEENPFAMFGGDQSSEMTEGEPYEEFTARVGMELSGTEDTLTLEEYLGQAASEQPLSDPVDNIGELAEKLKTSGRITPPVINFAEKASRSASDADTAGGSGFVTPTLAEIYVKQGWYDDAIKAYRALAANKPAEREKYEQRIAEIEGMKK